MDDEKYYGDTSDLYKRLKQEGLSDSEIEQQLEAAFGNNQFDFGKELSDKEKEDYYEEMRSQGWGFLFNKTK